MTSEEGTLRIQSPNYFAQAVGVKLVQVSANITNKQVCADMWQGGNAGWVIFTSLYIVQRTDIYKTNLSATWNQTRKGCLKHQMNHHKWSILFFILTDDTYLYVYIS